MSGDDSVVPGVRAVGALLTHDPGRIVELLHAGRLDGGRGELVERATALGIQVRAVNRRKLDALVEGIRHQDIIARVRSAEYAGWDQLVVGPPDRPPLLVAVDQVTDPRNLGALLRSAEALGATGALITKNRCARLGPTVTRTSAGASELLPVAMETNLARALREAAAAGVHIVGADLDGEPPEAIDWTGPTLLVIGAEGRGLRRLTRETCDSIATIPLVGATESLNAAVAGAILLNVAAWQRRGRSG